MRHILWRYRMKWPIFQLWGIFLDEVLGPPYLARKELTPWVDWSPNEIPLRFRGIAILPFNINKYLWIFTVRIFEGKFAKSQIFKRPQNRRKMSYGGVWGCKMGLLGPKNPTIYFSDRISGRIGRYMWFDIWPIRPENNIFGLCGPRRPILHPRTPS